jgi:hypothetical protein
MPLAYTDQAPSEVVAQVIIDLGLGTDPEVAVADWATRATGEGDYPDNCITVYDTTPFMDGRTHDGKLQGMYGIQIRIRARDPRNGWKKAKNIEYQLTQVLDRIVHRTVNSLDYRYMIHSLNGFGGVLPIGKEQSVSERNLFTINCYVNLKQY